MASTSLGLVQKQAPSKITSPVEREVYEAMRDFFLRNHESQRLITFLNQVHENKQWIVCDCLDSTVDIAQRPALTVARSPKDKLYLRNLISRRAHAKHCPFAYTPSPTAEPNSNKGKQEDPRDILDGALNLHRAAATGLTQGDTSNREKSSSSKSSKQIPRLGRVLLHLMEGAGMLYQGSSYQFLDGIKDMRLTAAELVAFTGTPLDEVLCLSVRQERELIRKIDDLRFVRSSAYGLMVVIVHEIERGPLSLLRYDKEGKVEWKCTPRGEVKVWARRSINKGPFMAAITYAPGAGSTEVCAQHAFILPILSNARPLPVESDLERRAAGALTRLAEWAERERKTPLHIIKPMHDIDVDGGQCRPDFIIRGPGGRAVIEVMGMIDDPEYMDRKSRTHPLMEQIGPLIEIGPSMGREELKVMNREVLRNTGFGARARRNS